LLTLSGPQKPLECVAFSPDGTQLITGGQDNTLKLWDAKTGRELHTLKGHSGAVHNVSYRPDGGQLASASEDGTVKIWDAYTGANIRTLKTNGIRMNSVAYHPDGRRLASGGNINVVIWDADAGRELLTLEGHGNNVLSLAFNRDGTRVVSGSGDRSIALWDTETGARLRTFKGHTNAVLSLAFSPDDNRLASASRDSTMQIWDVSTGQALRRLRGTGESLGSGTFSKDGAFLAACDTKGAVLLWDARPLTPDGKAEIEAVGLLENLFAKPLAKRDVRASLQNLTMLDEAARHQAAKLIDLYQEEIVPQKYYTTAWSIVRHPYSQVYDVQTAICQMRTACELAPQEAKFRLGLGVAHYRLGNFHPEKYAEALSLLADCDQREPITLSVLAMTQHKLGRHDEAHTTLARARKIVKESAFGSADDKVLFDQAASLIDGAGTTK
jgi:Tol biopolymer transport system component